MTRRWYAAAALVLTAFAAGCSSGSSGTASGNTTAANSPAPAPLSLAAAATGPAGTWAALPMGAASGANQFWQLFRLPEGGRTWVLQTPPDIATNGALILAGQDGQKLFVGERPSLDLTFSAFIATADKGRDWTTLPPTSGLAGVPDALAAAPDGQLIALGENAEVSAAGTANGSWSTLTTERALAATPAGQSCELTGLTAVATTPSGAPLLGGTCGRPGAVGVFGYTGGAWHETRLTLPAELAGERVQVLRLTRQASDDVALLEVGTGASANLIAAWSHDGARNWTLSPALRLAGSGATSASFGADGAIAVALTGGRGATLAGPGASWRPLPALPAGQGVLLALPGGGTTDALTATGNNLTVWQLAGKAATWAKTQVILVPIQYGSSG